MKEKLLNVAAPLRTSFALLDFLEAKPSSPSQECELARHLDNFLATSHLLEDDRIEPIEVSEIGRLHAEDMIVRDVMGARFPDLGLYWTVLDPIIRPGRDAVIATGDAIDDLLDIYQEIIEVKWLFDQHGQDEALAGLKFRYQRHLYMHVLPLRVYLEEMIRHG